jgi:hypothetical protein
MLNKKAHIALLGLSIVGAGLIFFPTRSFGLGISYDSVEYIAVANNILNGIGAIGFGGAHLVHQPLLYPAVLSALSYISGNDPSFSANWLNVLLFCATIYFTGLLLLRNLHSPLLAFIATAVMIVAIPLLKVYFMAWSEPLFITLTALYLLQVETYLTKKDRFSLSMLALVVGLAALTRYIGIVLILTGVISILFLRDGGFRERLFHAVLFTGFASFPIGINLVRNYIVSSTLFGSRSPSIFSLSQNLSFTTNSLFSWYLPNTIAQHRAALLLLGIMIGFLSGIRFKENWLQNKEIFTRLRSPLLFATAYIAFLIYSSTTTAYDQIGDRLLSPMFIPITLLIVTIGEVWLLGERGNFLNGRPNVLLRTLAACILTTLLWSRPIQVTPGLVKSISTQGWGYHSKSWRESETIGYLQQKFLQECALYTNAPEVLYYLTNLNAKFSPPKKKYNSPEQVSEISHLKGKWPAEDIACLVWFDKTRIDRSYLFSPDDLKQVSRIKLLTQTGDGAVYVVSKK